MPRAHTLSVYLYKMICVIILDQELISYRYWSCRSCWSDDLQKSLRLRCFKIWQDCSSSKYAFTDRVISDITS